MSIIHNVVLEDQVDKSASTTSGTETIDLPERGYLNQLNLRAGALCVWVDESPLNIWQMITKIEVLVNGSQVVKSYDARQLRALAWYHGMELPQLGTYARGGTGDKSMWNFPILFGRYPGDFKNGLNLGAYSNPQLKLTWDAAQSSFDGVSCDVASSPTFRYGLDAILTREGSGPVPTHYVKSSQINSWTTAASATKTTEVPRGYPLLGLMIGGRYNDIDTPDFFDNIKLDFDSGKWVAMDHGFQQLMGFNALHYPRPVQTAIYQSISAGDTPDPMVGMMDSLSWLSETTSLGNITIAGGEYPLYDISMQRADGSGSHTTRADVHLKWTGRLPHQCFYIPMSAFTGVPESTLSTNEYGRIDLKNAMASGVGSSGTMKVVAEYLIPNGQ